MQSMSFVLVLAGLVAAISPALLAVGERRGIAGGLAVLLTAAAILALFLSSSPIDRLMAGLIWLSAMLCGLAGFLDGSIKRHMGELGYRLIKLDADGLKSPEK